MGDRTAGSRVMVRVSVSVNVSFLLDMPSAPAFWSLMTQIDISCGCFFGFFAKRVVFLLLFMLFFSIWN